MNHTGSSTSSRSNSTGFYGTCEIELEEMVPVCDHPHALKRSSLASRWRCDGCRALFVPETNAVPRFRCLDGCDYDLCTRCVTRQRLDLLPVDQFINGDHSNSSNNSSMTATRELQLEEMVSVTGHPHALKRSLLISRWICDVCRGLSDPDLTPATRFRCLDGCDYDLCCDCLSDQRLDVVPQFSFTAPSSSAYLLPTLALEPSAPLLPSFEPNSTLHPEPHCIPNPTLDTPTQSTTTPPECSATPSQVFKEHRDRATGLQTNCAMVRVSTHPHPLLRMPDLGGWVCDGTLLPTGCQRMESSAALPRHRHQCTQCPASYDECESCVALHMVEDYSLIQDLQNQLSTQIQREASLRGFRRSPQLSARSNRGNPADGFFPALLGDATDPNSTEPSAPLFFASLLDKTIDSDPSAAANFSSLPSDLLNSSSSNSSNKFDRIPTPQRVQPSRLPEFLTDFPGSNLVSRHIDQVQCNEFTQQLLLRALQQEAEMTEAEYRSHFYSLPEMHEVHASIGLPLLNSEHFYDITFAIGPTGEKRRAYRGFLAQISPIWMHSFSVAKGFRETGLNRDTELRLPDITVGAFDAILTWAYLRDLRSIDLEDPNDALKLLLFSAQYEIQPLFLYAQCYFFENLSQFPDIDMYELALTLKLLGLQNCLRCCEWILFTLTANGNTASDIYSLWSFCSEFSFHVAMSAVLDLVAYALPLEELIELWELVQNVTSKSDPFHLLRQTLVQTLSINLKSFLVAEQIPLLLALKCIFRATRGDMPETAPHEQQIDVRMLSLISPQTIDSFERHLTSGKYPAEWLSILEHWTSATGESYSSNPGQIISWLEGFDKDSKYRDMAMLAISLTVDIGNLTSIIPVMQIIAPHRPDLLSSLLAGISIYLSMVLQTIHENKLLPTSAEPAMSNRVLKLWHFWRITAEPLVRLNGSVVVPDDLIPHFAEYFAIHLKSLLRAEALLQSLPSQLMSLIITSRSLRISFEIEVVQLLVRWSSLSQPPADLTSFPIRTHLLPPNQLSEVLSLIPNLQTTTNFTLSSSSFSSSRAPGWIEWHTLTTYFQERERFSEFFVSDDRLMLSLTSAGRSWAHAFTAVAPRPQHGCLVWKVDLENIGQLQRSRDSFDGIVLGIGSPVTGSCIGLTDQMTLWTLEHPVAPVLKLQDQAPTPMQKGDQVTVVMDLGQRCAHFLTNGRPVASLSGLSAELIRTASLVVAIRGNGRIRLCSNHVTWTGCSISPTDIPTECTNIIKPVAAGSLSLASSVGPTPPQAKKPMPLLLSVRRLMEKFRLPASSSTPSTADLAEADALDQFVWVDEVDEN